MSDPVMDKWLDKCNDRCSGCKEHHPSGWCQLYEKSIEDIEHCWMYEGDNERRA